MGKTPFLKKIHIYLKLFDKKVNKIFDEETGLIRKILKKLIDLGTL